MNSLLKQTFKVKTKYASDDVQIYQIMASKQSKLIGLSILALILFNFPFLSIFTKSSTIGGVPSIFIYLFLVWFGIIFFMRQNVESKSSKDKDKKKDDSQ